MNKHNSRYCLVVMSLLRLLMISLYIEDNKILFDFSLNAFPLFIYTKNEYTKNSKEFKQLIHFDKYFY